MDKPTLFIADLHLSDHTPKLNQLFYQFLQHWQNEANALYILGDLFEIWTGDDDDSQTAIQVATALNQFSQHTPVYFIAGNRDFLIGQNFAQKANITLLPAHHILQLYNHTILLTHGDEMCTDDKSYQRYRRIIQQPLLKKIFLALSFQKRKQLAERIRQASIKKKKEQHHYHLSDVTQKGVEQTISPYPQVDILIHGHTHRPNTHQHTIQNRTITRYVLPDWHGSEGGFLLINQQGLSFHSLHL